MRVERLAQRADRFGQVVGEVPVLAGPETVPAHVDRGAEPLRLVVQAGQVTALGRGEQPGRAGAAGGVELGGQRRPVGACELLGLLLDRRGLRDHDTSSVSMGCSAPSCTSSCCLRSVPPA